ncbi:MAG: DUF4236 domain-containing protein [Actinobacteria bacterium]|nr:DUF4236 domain-containing protein [Actinomycetota bacterium]
MRRPTRSYGSDSRKPGNTDRGRGAVSVFKVRKTWRLGPFGRVTVSAHSISGSLGIPGIIRATQSSTGRLTLTVGTGLGWLRLQRSWNLRRIGRGE